MTEITSDPFFTSQLDAIAIGDLSLGFPTHEGVVQLQGPLEDEVTHIHVSKKDFGNIVVKLSNGQPLQAELVVPVVVDGVPMDRHLRVFEEPVVELKLSKEDPTSVANSNVWVASGENLAIADLSLLQTLANTIGDFARIEQERKLKDTMDRKPSPKYL